MHIVWNRELKKFAAAVMGVMAACFLSANVAVSIYGNYVRSEHYSFCTAVFGNVQAAYPDVPEEVLVRVLEGRGNEAAGAAALARYGVFEGYGSASFAMQEKQLLFLYGAMNLGLILFFFLLCAVIYVYMKRRQCRIMGLTSYMRQLNRESYRLGIEENEDDELSGLRNEIYKLTVFLRERASRAAGQRKALADSVADISHQLKTPLTSATVLIDNLAENPDMDPCTRRRFLAEITNQITGMSWLVTTLLKLSRLDAGVVELQKSRFGLRSFAEEALRRLELAAELKQITFVLEIPEEAVLLADRKWTAEALLNLVKNAVEHSPEGCVVKVVGEENDVYTQITVRDYGGGISREEQEKLFRRFYNGSCAREDSSGIGLALAKEIVEKQGGYIAVESWPGRGTAFVMRFLR